MSATGTNFSSKHRSRLDAIDKAAASPDSRPKAVRAYWWDMEKVRSNRGTPEYRAQRESAEGLYAGSRAEARGIGWKAVIRSICLYCVGGDPDSPEKQGGPDMAPRNQVKNCQCNDCPIHPLREWEVSPTLRRARKEDEIRPGIASSSDAGPILNAS